MTVKKWLDSNCRSLSGKTVAVSGATGGIGKELCNHLALLGADLVLLDRNRQRSNSLGESLIRQYPELRVSYITVDLENMDEVTSAANELMTLDVDYLILNAGAYHIPRHNVSTGYGNVFQINFVSPIYLARKLLPLIQKKGGKVIAVGSIAHNYSKADPSDVDFSRRTKSSLIYGNAKRYLMFSMLGLDEYRDSVSVVHPGITFTNITAHYPKLIFAIIKHPMKLIFMRPRKAALCVVAGMFLEHGKNEWIGPRLFDIWGTPKVKPLTTCSPTETDYIVSTAEKIYGECEKFAIDSE